MLTIRYVRPDGVETVEADRIEEILGAGDGFLWFDMAAPTPEEEAVIHLPALGIQPLAKQDMLEDLHLPKLDIYDDQAMLTVHAIEVERSVVEITTVEVDIVLARNYLFTFRRRRVASLLAVARALDEGTSVIDRPALLLHHILDAMDDVFVPFLDRLGQRLDVVEEEVLLQQPSTITRSEIFQLRRDLITLRRISVPQAEVLRQLSREQIPVVDPKDRPLFRDVYDHLFKMAEVSEAYRQLVESAYDMYRSLRDEELNRRLTVLTMISALLLPITTIAGIYGMNFEHMPEIPQPWAYPAVWAIFIIIIIGGLLMFRAWGWIGGKAEAERAAQERRKGMDVLDIPVLGTVLKVPAYGARLAVKGTRGMLRIGRWLGRSPTVDTQRRD